MAPVDDQDVFASLYLPVENTNYANINTTCERSFEISHFLHSSVVPAVGIIILLTILQNLRDRKISRPFTFITPIQFLDGYHNRWACAATFGATTSTVAALFYRDVTGFFDIDASMWATAMLIFLCILETCINYYPLFACLATPHIVLGSVIGFLYAATWFFVQALYLFECPLLDANMSSPFRLNLPYEGVIIQWPAFLCLIFVMGKFLSNLWCAFRGRYSVLWKQTRIGQDHQVTYVRNLLNGDIRQRSMFQDGSIFERFRYRPIPGFLFPTRVVVAVAVSLFFLYQIAVGYVYLGALLFIKVLDEIKNTIPIPLPTTKINMLEILHTFWIIAEVLWFVVTAVVLLATCSYFYLILRNYKIHFLKLCRGNRSFLPVNKLQPYEMMADSMRWGGFQVAYMVWGFLLSHIVAYLFVIILIGIVYLPIAFDKADLLLEIFKTLGIPFAVNIVVYYSQSICARFMFLQPRIEPENCSLPLAINNRRAYENVSYYTFIANITVGFMSSLFRLMTSLMLGVLMLGRIDRAFLLGGFEYWDRGYQAYIGMIMVDYTHNHPVLRVFAQLLSDSITFKGSVTQPDPRHRVCKRRWQLLYTLLNNPTLITKRKHYLDGQEASSWTLVNKVYDTNTDFANLDDTGKVRYVLRCMIAGSPTFVRRPVQPEEQDSAMASFESSRSASPRI